MVNAICKELVMQKNYTQEESIQTIYFGGGTPSLLLAPEMEQVLNTVHSNFKVATDAEVTLEANPDDLSEQKIRDFKSLGINRLSIGVQSFDDDVLHFLNRAHNAKEAYACIALAHQIGIHNISLDLIYAIPDRGQDLWIKDLQQAVDLAPTHLSSYSLTIEPQTVFGRWADKGKLKTVSNDYAADQFELMVDFLATNDFEQYEVSNFCKVGFESKHNTSYWQRQIYLGVGPSAHSYNLKSRQFNINNNKKYLDAISQGKIPFTEETLSDQDHINDYLLTRLRTKWGIDMQWLKDTYQHDLFGINQKYLNSLIKTRKAQLKGDQLVLTRSGLLMADQIAADLFT